MMIQSSDRTTTMKIMIPPTTTTTTTSAIDGQWCTNLSMSSMMSRRKDSGRCENECHGVQMSETAKLLGK